MIGGTEGTVVAGAVDAAEGTPASSASKGFAVAGVAVQCVVVGGYCGRGAPVALESVLLLRWARDDTTIVVLRTRGRGHEAVGAAVWGLAHESRLGIWVVLETAVGVGIGAGIDVAGLLVLGARYTVGRLLVRTMLASVQTGEALYPGGEGTSLAGGLCGTNVSISGIGIGLRQPGRIWLQRYSMIDWADVGVYMCWRLTLWSCSKLRGGHGDWKLALKMTATATNNCESGRRAIQQQQDGGPAS